MQVLKALLALGAVITSSLALEQTPCSEICRPVCNSQPSVCFDVCKKTCNGVPNSIDTNDIYFDTRMAFELPGEEIITGGDSSVIPLNDDYYFTTLNGKLYRYTVSSSQTAPLQLIMLYRVPYSRLDQSNGKGLYSVAVDQSYYKNNKLYLLYSSRPESSEDRRRFLPGSKTDPNLLSTATLDHYTTIQEITMNGLHAEPGPILKRVEQYTQDAVGNWLGSIHPNPTVRGNTNRLLMATGGNPKEDGLIAMFNSHLSSLTLMSENNKGEVRTEVWSSAVRRPLYCAATIMRTDIVRCIVETEDKDGVVNGTMLYSFKQGSNYGSEAFKRHCSANNLACKQRIEDVMNSDGLIAFPSTECAVRSLTVYSGSRDRMPSFFGKALAVRESCYRPDTKQISEAQLLYIDYNSGYGRWRATPLKIYLQHRFLTNVTILGADRQNTLMIAGYSLTSGTVVVQELLPKKASDFLAY